MNQEIRIAGIGEILMDVFEDQTATIGGAPFNVAFHASQLLTAFGRGRADIVSAIGRDRWGEHILESLKTAAISPQYLAISEEYPTGIASVFVSQADAGFEIAPQAAWDHLSATPATDALADQCSAVAFGSLAQRHEQSGAMIRAFVARVQGHRLYDINLRQNTTDGVRGYSSEIIHKSCAVATIVKANEGELAELSEEFGFSTGGHKANSDGATDRVWSQMEQLARTYNLWAVVITRGGKGALLLSQTERVQLPDSTLSPEAIHPVGAGDAFSAGLLYSLSQRLPLTLCAHIADKLASWVTGYTSATPRLTEEIQRQIGDLESQAVR